jgi:hypothetical protein
MKALIVAAIVVAALALGGSAHAAQISSPAIFGNQIQDTAECVVLNFGTRALAVTVKILNDAGQPAATSTCDGPLGGGQFCSVAARITPQHAFACVATAPSTSMLRGTLILDQRVLDDFGVAQLQPIRSAPLR